MKTLGAEHEERGAAGCDGLRKGDRLAGEEARVTAKLDPEEGGLTEELADEPATRAFVNGARRVHLAQPSLVQHGDAVGHGQRLALVMGDTDGGHAETFVQGAEFDLHMVTQLLVERRERFIHQQDAGLKDDRAGKGDALALPSGEFRDAAVAESFQPDGLQCSAYALG